MIDENRKIVITPYLARKLQILSLLAIWFVVLQHSSYGVSTGNCSGLLYRDLVAFGIADFPVPYFFVVSGFFLMKKFDGTFRWYKSEIAKRMRTLVRPYLIFCTLGIAIFNECPYRPILANYGITSQLPSVGTLWYVRTLFVLCLASPLIIGVTALLAKWRQLRVVIICILPLLLVFHLPCQSSVVAPLLYFSFGVFLSQYGACLGEVPVKLKVWVALLLMSALLTIRIVYSFCHPGEEQILQKAINPGCLILLWYGYDVLYSHSKCIRGLVEIIPNWVVNSTFFVYCIESFVRRLVNLTIFNPVKISNWLSSPVGALVNGMLVFISGIALAMILNRFVPRLYGVLSGGRGVRQKQSR